MSEEEQLAYALSLSMDHGDARTQTDEQLAHALSQEEQGLAQVHAQPEPTAGTEGPTMRVRVVGGEDVPGVGMVGAYVQYTLRLEMAGGSSTDCLARRFSDFVALLEKFKKSGAAGAVVESWRRRLLVEKRHTGSRSRAETVVATRCKLLQKMMDELMVLPEFASAPEVGAFLFG